MPGFLVRNWATQANDPLINVFGGSSLALMASKAVQSLPLLRPPQKKSYPLLMDGSPCQPIMRPFPNVTNSPLLLATVWRIISTRIPVLGSGATLETAHQSVHDQAAILGSPEVRSIELGPTVRVPGTSVAVTIRSTSAPAFKLVNITGVAGPVGLA